MLNGIALKQMGKELFPSYSLKAQFLSWQRGYVILNLL